MTAFIVDNDGDFKAYDGANPRFEKRLPAGIYTPFHSPAGVFFRPASLAIENLVSLDTKPARLVQREIDDFFSAQITARLASAGLKHRRGIILYGKPGTGKTSLVRMLIPQMVAKDAVVLLIQRSADPLERVFIPAIRKFDPDRPIVVICDEFERVAAYSQGELLQLLDGLSSPDHLLFIGMTNYLEQMSNAFKQRPSRFSLVLEMPPLEREIRLAYITLKFPSMEPALLNQLVEMTEGKPLDYLEEGCKLAVMGYDSDEIRDRLIENTAVALTADEGGEIGESEDND